VPHGDDLTIFRTLLSLYAKDTDPLPEREVTRAAFFERLSLISPQVRLTDEQLLRGLQRLVYSSWEVRSVIRTGEQPLIIEYHFHLTTLLTTADNETRSLDTLTYRIPDLAL